MQTLSFPRNLRLSSAVISTLTIVLACSAETGNRETGGESSRQAQQAESADAKRAPSDGTAPDFRLVDTEGNEHALADYLRAGKTVVLEWFNPDCPFVRKHHLSHHSMVELQREFEDKGVVWLAINSGAPGMQGAGLERNRAARDEYGIGYPVLLDESGNVGRSYGAKTTPHMYVIEPGGRIAYQGAIDDDRGTKDLGSTNFVRNAVEQLLAGKPVEVPTSQPYGCSVKYGASPSRSM